MLLFVLLFWERVYCSYPTSTSIILAYLAAQLNLRIPFTRAFTHRAEQSKFIAQDTCHACVFFVPKIHPRKKGYGNVAQERNYFSTPPPSLTLQYGDFNARKSGTALESNLHFKRIFAWHA